MKLGILTTVLLLLMGCSTTPATPCATELECRVQALEEAQAVQKRCVFIHGADSIICGGRQ